MHLISWGGGGVQIVSHCRPTYMTWNPVELLPRNPNYDTNPTLLKETPLIFSFIVHYYCDVTQEYCESWVILWCSSERGGEGGDIILQLAAEPVPQALVRVKQEMYRHDLRGLHHCNWMWFSPPRHVLSRISLSSCHWRPWCTPCLTHLSYCYLIPWWHIQIRVLIYWRQMSSGVPPLVSLPRGPPPLWWVAVGEQRRVPPSCGAS